MAKQLDPKIGAVLKEYGFGADACWDCHGTWVVYHKVLEQIAAKASIKWDDPQIIEASGATGIAALSVRGWLGERSEWSIGEASPKNNKNAYPWAMAEKRGKDRVILKLIGLHGLAYSEEEADDFKNGAPDSNQQPPAKQKNHEPKAADSKPDTGEAYREKTPDDSAEYAFEWLEKAGSQGLSALAAAWPHIYGKYKTAPFMTDLTERKDELKAQLQKRTA